MDRALYAALLERHTVAGDGVTSTRVDYAALQTSAEWDALVESLRRSDPSAFGSREEQLAFWIDAYNILTIDLVRRHYPIDGIRSIEDLPGPVWKQPAGEIAGRTYSLDEIEHQILRPMGEPRVHAAIVCASISCPPLRREPYRAGALDAQLEGNMRRWLTDPAQGVRIDRAANTLHLSPIFDWFAGDFEGGVITFVAAHLPAEDADWIRAQGPALQIRYLDYDWSLNDITGARGPRDQGPRTV